MESPRQDILHIIDGFPFPVSHFKRAPSCQRFKGEASYGYCASKNEHYYGFKGHLIVNMEGVIAGLALTPAHISERALALPLSEGVHGLLLGDKGYPGKDLKAQHK